MPLQVVQEIGDDVYLGIWENNERCPDANVGLPICDINYLETFTNPSTRSQRYCARLLVQEMSKRFSFEYQGIKHTEFGAPTVDASWHLCLSHTSEFTIAIFSPFPMGVDIERPNESIFVVAPRLFAEEEIILTDGSLEQLSFLWCIKESAYKLYQKRKLNFKQDIRVLNFNFKDKSFELLLAGEDLVKGKMMHLKNHCVAFCSYSG